MKYSIFALILLLAAQGSFAEGARRHRHRHGHQTQQVEVEPAEESSDDTTTTENIVFAYRSNGENEEQSSSNSVEARLRTLEQDVRHLCEEDEEDVDRQIRMIGVTCKCPKTEAPVCGSDNVTYYNRCYLHCRAEAAARSYNSK